MCLEVANPYDVLQLLHSSQLLTEGDTQGLTGFQSEIFSRGVFFGCTNWAQS